MNRFTICMALLFAFNAYAQQGGAVDRKDVDSKSKQTTFVERGFALCPPEGGTPSEPS